MLGDASVIEAETPGISVVIPTFQRRDVVLRSVAALAEQTYRGGFEVIVVVDGSTDGTAEALRALPRPPQVVEQANAGAAAARNAGARLARGRIILFLDDDMQADPHLLEEHARLHEQGAEAVIGHIPLHPDSPRNFLSRHVGAWAEQRRETLARPGASIGMAEVLTGNLSVRRELFRRLGGFDQRFTMNGAFGNEDIDFGCRLIQGGARIAFGPQAVSWQRYVVRPAANLRQWRQGGAADVALARKYPAMAADIFAAHRGNSPAARLAYRPLAAMPVLGPLLADVAEAAALAAVARAPEKRLAARAFFIVRSLEYWRGVREGGGIPRPRPVRVLAYHAIADLAHDPLLKPYAVPPEAFEAQLDALLAAGCHFVSAEELLRCLRDGQGLPRRATLLTFDDCYECLLQVAAPMLRARGIPALAFAVAGQVGGTNAWDRAKGGSALRLLDAEGLRALTRQGIEIGAHSRTHPDLTTLRGAALEGELAGAAEDLAALGLPRPRFVAYPHGRHDAAVRAAAARSYALGFALGRGVASRTVDPFAVPRTEIRRGQAGWRFRLRVALAPGA